jgi:hypothetical protein
MVSGRHITCFGLLGWRTGVGRVPAVLMAAAAAVRVTGVRLESRHLASQTGGCHVSAVQCTGRW